MFEDKITINKILLVAFIARVLLLLAVTVPADDFSQLRAPDTASYLSLSSELVENGNFARGDLPEITRTPGYPIFLIPGVLSGSPDIVTCILQIMVSCLTVYLLFKVALLIFDSRRVALLCAMLYAFEPLSVLFSNKLLTETLFACIVMLFLYYLTLFFKKQRIRHLLTSAVILSASVYVRPVSYFLPLAVGGVIILSAIPRKNRDIKLLKYAGGFILLSIMLIGAWQIRNSVKTGYSGFSAISDINLYYYLGASVLAAEEGVSYYGKQRQMGYANAEIYFNQHPEQRDWSRGERFEYMRKKGLGIVLKNPITYAAIHLKGIARIMMDPGAIEYVRLFGLYPRSGGLLGEVVDKGLLAVVKTLFLERPLIFWLNFLFGLILLLYYTLCAVALLPKNFVNSMPVIMVLIVIAYFVLISGGPQASGRFRHPVMPLICLLAGYGLNCVISGGKRKMYV